jgi:hypothetical protein
MTGRRRITTDIRRLLVAKKKGVAKRVWLTPLDPDTMSYVAYSTDNWDENAMNVKLADCNRHISLYFANDRKGKAKFDRLIKILIEAREIMDGEDT